MKKDVYEMVTDRIIEQLEQGVISWEKPWGGVIDGAYNRISKKPYSLLNQMLLQHSGEYATFKQWSELEDNDKKQIELAEYLNIKQTTYSKYELGKINIPIEVFIKLADYYDVSIDYLVGRSIKKK